VTVFAGDESVPRDDESAEIWKSVGIPEERIYFLLAQITGGDLPARQGHAVPTPRCLWIPARLPAGLTVGQAVTVEVF